MGTGRIQPTRPSIISLQIFLREPRGKTEYRGVACEVRSAPNTDAIV
jgi:hypothetical protein